MACDITAGIAKRCKDGIGGLKKLYLFNYQEDPFTVTDKVATAINAGITEVFEYAIEGDLNTLVEDLVSDRNTKTSVNTQTLTITIGKLDVSSAVQLDLLSKGTPMAVVVDRNDVYHAIGIDDGIDFNINAQSGGAKTDLNGYTITGVSTTKEISPKLDAATITAFEALV